MSSFAEILKREFPGSLRDGEYVSRTSTLLSPLGFTADNAIACVATCRDELCRPVRERIHAEWGEAFNFSSLAGLPTLGRTGFQAFHAHAPRTYSRRRHLYYAMPHIGIDADGTLGPVTRSGIPDGSNACGALFAVASAIESGASGPPFDRHDIEQSLLRKRLAELVPEGEVPGPVELVRLAEREIRRELQAGIDATVDTGEVDYGFFTGIQIHGPDRRDYIYPVASYAVVAGERHDFDPNSLP